MSQPAPNKRLQRALSFAMRSLESRRNVLVHCSSGKDRTGLFLSYFLCATEGLSPGDAIREVRRVRPIALSADGWETFAHRVLAELRSVGPQAREFSRHGSVA
jgi:protein-tyrosine phosphatase